MLINKTIPRNVVFVAWINWIIAKHCQLHQKCTFFQIMLQCVCLLLQICTKNSNCREMGDIKASWCGIVCCMSGAITKITILQDIRQYICIYAEQGSANTILHCHSSTNWAAFVIKLNYNTNTVVCVSSYICFSQYFRLKFCVKT